MVGAVAQAETACGQVGAVVGPGVAAPFLIGAARLVEIGEGDDRVAHVVGAEIVGDVELGRRALGKADGSAVELVDALHVEAFLDHEALAVEEQGQGEFDAAAVVAHIGPGKAVGEDVDDAGLQRGVDLAERHVHDLGAVSGK